MASDVENVLELIREKNVEFVDFRFTDPRGKWQHVSQTTAIVNEDTFTDGVMFDGSSIAGWKDISQSDMCMMPDASTAVIDPFTAQPTLILFCNILEPTTGESYERDPRSTALRAEAFLKSSGIGETAFFGPRPSSSCSTMCAGTCR